MKNLNTYPYFDEVLDPRTVGQFQKYLKDRRAYALSSLREAVLKDEREWYRGMVCSLNNILEDLDETLWFQDDYSDVRFEAEPEFNTNPQYVSPGLSPSGGTPTSLAQSRENVILALLDAIFDEDDVYVIEI